MNRKQFSEDTYKTLLFLIEHPEFKDKIGTALIQRTFRIGYGRAADVIDELCECGIIAKPTVKGIGSYCTLLVSLDGLRKILEPQSEGLTMIEKIDNYKGKILPIVGRPGMGQESVALQIAIDYHARYGKTVLIFNPVEEEYSLKSRIVCLRDRYPYFNATGGKMSEEHQKKFDDAVEGLYKSGFVIDSTKEPSEIYIYDKACDTEGVGLVVILDYDFITERENPIFLDMLARHLDAPVVVSALVERKVDRRRDKLPKRKDIKSEELKNQDTVVLVYRENYYINSEGDFEDIVLSVDRHGELEALQFAYNTHTFKVYKNELSKQRGNDCNALAIHSPNTTNATDLLPTATKGILCEALYFLDGVNTYRVEVPIYTVEKWVQDGLATPFPTNNSKMMFEELKRTFQEYCQEKELPYTSWINE